MEVLWPLAPANVSSSKRKGCSSPDGAQRTRHSFHALRPSGRKRRSYLFFIRRANWEKGLDLAVRVGARSGMRLVMAVKMTEKHEQEYFHEHVDPWLAKGADVTLLGEITPGREIPALCTCPGHAVYIVEWEATVWAGDD